MVKSVLMIDGGNLRVLARQADKAYTPAYIEKVALGVTKHDELLRVLYYDCEPYQGVQPQPISGEDMDFKKSPKWLDELAGRNHFAVRKGTVKFRGFVLKKGAYGKAELTDKDFQPNFEQKGVDMRIGLDIASYSMERLVDKITIISQDTDLIPATKLARKCGLSVELITFPKCKMAHELKMHADIVRKFDWPA